MKFQLEEGLVVARRHSTADHLASNISYLWTYDIYGPIRYTFDAFGMGF
jgi:hypothetical protein